jgi:hypothetical protein
VIGQESERDCVEVEISERALEDVGEDLNKEFIRISFLPSCAFRTKSEDTSRAIVFS